MRALDGRLFHVSVCVFGLRVARGNAQRRWPEFVFGRLHGKGLLSLKPGKSGSRSKHMPTVLIFNIEYDDGRKCNIVYTI